MRIQQSFVNPCSRLKQKDYGHEVPQVGFLEKHGKRIGAAILAISTVIVVGATILAAVYLVSDAIDNIMANQERFYIERRQ